MNSEGFDPSIGRSRRKSILTLNLFNIFFHNNQNMMIIFIVLRTEAMLIILLFCFVYNVCSYIIANSSHGPQFIFPLFSSTIQTGPSLSPIKEVSSSVELEAARPCSRPESLTDNDDDTEERTFKTPRPPTGKKKTNDKEERTFKRPRPPTGRKKTNMKYRNFAKTRTETRGDNQKQQNPTTPDNQKQQNPTTPDTRKDLSTDPFNNEKVDEEDSNVSVRSVTPNKQTNAKKGDMSYEQNTPNTNSVYEANDATPHQEVNNDKQTILPFSVAAANHLRYIKVSLDELYTTSRDMVQLSITFRDEEETHKIRIMEDSLITVNYAQNPEDVRKGYRYLNARLVIVSPHNLLF